MYKISLPEQIAAQVSASAALRSGAGVLSYKELHEQSGRLASYLGSLSVVKGSSIAVCLDRSFAQIVSILASMRAGAAYIPIDPAWPDARVQHILSDSGATVFIAPEELSKRIVCSARALDLNSEAAQIASCPDGSTPATLASDDLAYVIYTSGSTGTPKGVEITHGNLISLIDWHIDAFKISGNDRASHLAGLGFDAAVWEVWPYLSVGASVSLVDDTTRTSPQLLQRWICEEQITIAFVPTPVAEPMVNLEWPAHTRLRTLLTGGDTLHGRPIRPLPFAFVNNYGPTECTVVATSGPVMPEMEALPSIGKAILGTTIYILNDEQQLSASGEVGEIYIGGTSVGRGYRNLPAQTATSFLLDPFSPVIGARMYRTGDRGVLLADGQISFCGRSDTQEKIRGNRIELEEIVHTLNLHQDVSFSVVVTSGDTEQEKHLVAYVLPVEGASPSVRELQEFATKFLPSYMIPSVYVELEALPLSANGKVDRASLPVPSAENTLMEEPLREATTETEIALLALVRDLLQTNKVGVDDDFFLIGGHSLLGTQLALRVRENFGVMLTLRDLFDAATVALLAERVESLIMEELGNMTEEEALRMVVDETER